MLFVGDGSVLPRESSISQRPLETAVRFRSPDEMRVTVRLPSGRVVRGMAVPVGLLVITGGGYHGKTTLLSAIQQGIYDHVEGDGRELVVSRRYTVYVRAEDGRLVSNVDISSFIEGLPSGEDTRRYTSMNSSGSTSMASSLSEAIEAGAEVVLIDEDTSATNLLFKDETMQGIVRVNPIKPLSAQVRSMIERTGVGVVVVASASSAFLASADAVVLMENYVPKLINSRPTTFGVAHDFRPPAPRVFRGVKGLRKVRARGMRIAVEYADGTKFELDLSRNPRVVEVGQARLIAYAIRSLARVPRPIPVRELVRYVNDRLAREGFRALADHVPPDLTIVDGFDVVWTLNRLYNAVFTQERARV